MEFENIIYKVDGGIATIQLNRPKALNALNSDINHDIMEAIKLVQGGRQRPGTHHDRL